MKTITIHVSESIYEEFRAYAQRVGRNASELIREAMEAYREKHLGGRTSLLDRRPVAAGGTIEPITGCDDVLEEMLNR